MMLADVCRACYDKIEECSECTGFGLSMNWLCDVCSRVYESVVAILSPGRMILSLRLAVTMAFSHREC